MRGFSNFAFKTTYSPVNLADLENESTDSIDKNFLHSNGYIRSAAAPVKILGSGEFSRPVVIVADKFSASARAAIEKSGGQAIELASKSDVE
jgi:large subunit ribosomal protein L15